MKKLLFLLCVLFVTKISAQSGQGTESQSVFLPQGFGLGLLNAYGTSSICNDISNLSFMNPASITQFDNYSLGLSYQFNTNIEDVYNANINTDRIHNFVPQSFGALMKLDYLTFGLGFGQTYNLLLDFEPIPVTNIQNPEGTGEYFSPILETSNMDFSLITACDVGSFIGINNLNLGVKVSLSRLHQYEKIWHTDARVSDYKLGFTTGFVYKLDIDNGRKLEAGISYRSKNKFTDEFEDENPKLISVDPDTNRFQINSVASEFSLTAYFPDEINTDLSIDVTDKFKLLTSFNAVLWKSQPTIWENQFIYSTSAVFKFSEKVTASLGYYSSDMELKKENYFSREGNEFNVFFLTAGLKLSLNNFNIDIALADSHLMSGEFRQQTIGKIALGLKL